MLNLILSAPLKPCFSLSPLFLSSLYLSGFFVSVRGNCGVGVSTKLVPAWAGLPLFLTLNVFLIFTWPLGILGDEVPGCSELQLNNWAVLRTDVTPASLFCPGSSNSFEDEEGTGIQRSKYPTPP